MPQQTKSNDLRGFVERIVSIEAERADLAGDVKAVYLEAKADGYSPPALRKIVKEKLETDEARAKRHEVERVADSYRAALGMLSDTPLGEATITRVRAEATEAVKDLAAAAAAAARRKKKSDRPTVAYPSSPTAAETLDNLTAAS